MPLSVPPNHLYLSRKSSPNGFISESLLVVTTFSGDMNNRWPCGGTDSLATSTCLSLPGGFRDLYPMVQDVPGGSVGKESTCNAGDTGVADLIPGMGRSPWEESMATQSSIHAWRILWTEEPGGLQSIGLQRIRYD